MERAQGKLDGRLGTRLDNYLIQNKQSNDTTCALLQVKFSGYLCIALCN